MYTTKETIELDGAQGEGGGQVLRTAVSLSLCTQQPFHLINIRAGRKKPGLMRQHLTAVNAAAKISNAQVRGNRVASQELWFAPGPVVGGEYQFAVGTAGSASLVLQTLLYPLLLADRASILIVEGGTHNPWAPPFDYLDQVFLPLLRRTGPQVEAYLERYGFYPAGGGRIRLVIKPVKKLQGFELRERGEIKRREACVVLCGIAENVAHREHKRVKEKLGWPRECLTRTTPPTNQGPGNVLAITLESEHITEQFTSFGRIGVPAETVADQAIDETCAYLAAGAPVGPYLADQILLPLALAGQGAFTSQPPSRHSITQREVIGAFLDTTIEFRRLNGKQWITLFGAS